MQERFFVQIDPQLVAQNPSFPGLNNIFIVYRQKAARALLLMPAVDRNENPAGKERTAECMRASIFIPDHTYITAFFV